MSRTLKQVQIIFSLIIILSLTISLTQPKPSFAQDGDGIKRQYNPESGKVSFISSDSEHPLAATQALRAEPGTLLTDPAMAIAQRFGVEFGLTDPLRELTAIHTKHSGSNRKLVQYQQNFRGVPVMGGELIVNTNTDGDLYSMNGEVSSNLSVLTQPTINPSQAR